MSRLVYIFCVYAAWRRRRRNCIKYERRAAHKTHMGGGVLRVEGMSRRAKATGMAKETEYDHGPFGNPRVGSIVLTPSSRS